MLLIIAAVIVVVGLIVGGVAWASSRSHVVQADDSGQVRLYTGLPYSPLGMSLLNDGQVIGVPAASVLAEEPSALDQGVQGEGEATALAVRLAWHYGIPTTWASPRAAPVPTPKAVKKKAAKTGAKAARAQKKKAAAAQAAARKRG